MSKARKRKQYETVLDEHIRECHCCGGSLARNVTEETEWCLNPDCSAREVRFSMPYIEVEGL